MKLRLTPGPLSCAVATLLVVFSPRLGAVDASSLVTVRSIQAKPGAANAAIMAYLGEPVPPPVELDPKYTADGLVTACQAMCKKLGVELEKLTVDETEFPFLVSGVIRGTHDLQALPEVLRAMPGYGYGGSVVGRRDGKTFFSLNLIASDHYPPTQRAAIQRRLMVRLQMLSANDSDSRR